MTEKRVTYALKILMVLVLAFFVGKFALDFLAHIRVVVYMLIGAIFLAYLIYPAVHWLHRRMPLALAIVLVYAAIAVTLLVVGWFVIPRLVDDVVAFVAYYPQIVARVDGLVYDPNDPITSRLPEWMRTELVKLPAELAMWGKLHGFETAGKLVFMLVGTFAAFATFIIVPLITAYLLLDLEHLKRTLESIVPEKHWRATLELLADFDAAIGGFIRGQMLVALSVGVLITIALMIMHVKYAFLLGLLAAIGDLIPYVGAIIAFLPAFITAFAGNGWVTALFVLVAFILIYEVEGHLLAPNIVGKTVRLSPFVVLLSLLIGAELGGIVGMLVAVPIVGALRAVGLRVFRPKPANEPIP